MKKTTSYQQNKSGAMAPICGNRSGRTAPFKNISMILLRCWPISGAGR